MHGDGGGCAISLAAAAVRRNIAFRRINDVLPNQHRAILQQAEQRQGRQKSASAVTAAAASRRLTGRRHPRLAWATATIDGIAAMP